MARSHNKRTDSEKVGLEEVVPSQMAHKAGMDADYEGHDSEWAAFSPYLELHDHRCLGAFAVR